MRDVLAATLRMAAGVLIAGLVCHALTGCAQSLRLTRLATAARRPSNVAVFFAVDRASGQPVTNLSSEAFGIYEDGRLLSRQQSRQTLLDPQRAAVHYTLLLLDMSASVSASDQLAAISGATRALVSALARSQQVAVYAFDGSKNLYEIAPFALPGPQTLARVERLRTFESKDPATNLNGAVLAALSQLDDTVQHGSAPLRFGNLVVLTDGTDRANRVPYQQMIDAVEASPHSVYSVGVGRELDDSTLARIGKAGYVRVEDSAAARSAFEEVGDRIVRATRRYYLLSYCSPARAGQHRVALEVTAAEQRGELDYAFDATGFGAGCDPEQAPPLGADTSSR